MERHNHSPEQPERLSLNEAQTTALQDICSHYNVPFDADHYIVNSNDAWMMPSYAEGWVGGPANAEHTIYVGVSPDGRINS